MTAQSTIDALRGPHSKDNDRCAECGAKRTAAIHSIGLVKGEVWGHRFVEKVKDTGGNHGR